MKIVLALGAAVALTVGTVQADLIIDQDQPLAEVYMAGFSQGDLAQSFQTQAYDHIAGAGIFLQPGIGTTDNVTIELWDFLPTEGGTMLTSGSAMGTEGDWVDVEWAPYTIAADTTYYLVFTGNQTLGISGTVSDSYAYGHVFANPGFNPFPGYDYTFRTWVVPTPGALALLGLAGLARRRRR